MSERNGQDREGWLSVYAVVIASALALVLMIGNDYQIAAGRVDLKIMTLRLQKQAPTIPKLGKLRNRIRAKAEELQKAAFFLVISLALISVAIASSGFVVRPIFLASLFAAGCGAVYALI